MGGIFDGADRPHGFPRTMVFGGDMAGDDDPQPRQNSPRQWGAPISRPKKSGYIPASQRGSAVGKKGNDSWGGSNTSRQHFNQDWRTYSSQVGRHNSPESQATAGRTSKENSPVFGKHSTSPIVGVNPGAKTSPQVNVPVPAGQSSPAIVIHVNHGTVPSASVAPNVPAAPAPTENSWDIPDKHSDKGSENNSNRSNHAWGHEKKESWAMNMPGGWGASNVESQANSTGWNNNEGDGAQVNDDWDNGNDQLQEDNDGWNNNGESGAQGNDDWGATTGGAQESNTGWNTNGNDNSGWNNKKNDNGGGQENSDWNNNGNGDNQESKEGHSAQYASASDCGNAGGKKKHNNHSWGGATEKKNGWDMPAKDKKGSQGKAASDKANGFPKYTMEFTQSPNNMSNASQNNGIAPTNWPHNDAAANIAPVPLPTSG